VYTKSRTIADDVSLSARQVGVRLSHISQSDDIPLDVRVWSRTGGGRTWRIEIPDTSALSAYLAETVDEAEPALC